jgi:hypothetical protein
LERRPGQSGEERRDNGGAPLNRLTDEARTLLIEARDGWEKFGQMEAVARIEGQLQHLDEQAKRAAPEEGTDMFDIVITAAGGIRVGASRTLDIATVTAKELIDALRG